MFLLLFLYVSSWFHPICWDKTGIYILTKKYFFYPSKYNYFSLKKFVFLTNESNNNLSHFMPVTVLEKILTFLYSTLSNFLLTISVKNWLYVGNIWNKIPLLQKYWLYI